MLIRVMYRDNTCNMVIAGEYDDKNLSCIKIHCGLAEGGLQ
jgi:hypothetical protein